MTQQEFFKTWETKHPKSFKKWLIFISSNINGLRNCNGLEYHFYFNCDCGCKFQTFSLNFEMLTGLIEKFFEDNNIHIVINYDLNFSKYRYYIYDKINCNYNIIGKDTTKKEAQMQAYLKSAEILEKKDSEKMKNKLIKEIEKIFEKEKKKLEKSQRENMPGDIDDFENSSRLSELDVLQKKIMKKLMEANYE